LPGSGAVPDQTDSIDRNGDGVNNATILLVEDETRLRELSRMLAEIRLQVWEASSGLEALKLWAKKKDKIDLLLTDLVMPDGISGLELAGNSRPETLA
jgi:CheY-like chemotaxis protein